MQNRFLTLWNAHIILESLPISSSGHVTLLNNLLAKIRKEKPVIISNALDHLMHIPTALILSMVLSWAYFSYTREHPVTLSTVYSWLIAAFIANGITGLFYLLKRKTFTQNFPLWVGFFITSLSLLSLYKVEPGTTHYISTTDALFIGLSQCLALLPGVSRMALTTTTALSRGIAPITSIFFSLFLELGLIIAALAKIYLDKPAHKSELRYINEVASKHYKALTLSSIISLLLLAAVIVSVQAGNFVLFGWYMLLVSIISLFTHIKQQSNVPFK